MNPTDSRSAAWISWNPAATHTLTSVGPRTTTQGTGSRIVPTTRMNSTSTMAKSTGWCANPIMKPSRPCKAPIRLSSQLSGPLAAMMMNTDDVILTALKIVAPSTRGVSVR